MLYCIYCMLAFGQYLKHSSHSALELIISELNPKVLNTILDLHENCEGLPLLSKQQFCFGEGKGTSFSLT